MADKKCSLRQEFTKGLIKENPVLRLVLGTCPTLATSTSMVNAIGMGIAATIVLVCSNIAISALRKVIPAKVRIPAYVIIIASFVTIVQMLVKAFVPALDAALGVFLPLIVVNCIILGRAEMFARKNGVIDSAIDGLGMGIGFLVALIMIGAIREFFGNGSLAGIEIGFMQSCKIPILVAAPGGFMVYGIVIAIMNKLTEKRGGVKKKSFSCEGCPSAAACNKASCTQNGEPKTDVEEA
jgi:electron transport complex protein RnfE